LFFPINPTRYAQKKPAICSLFIRLMIVVLNNHTGLPKQRPDSSGLSCMHSGCDRCFLILTAINLYAVNRKTVRIMTKCRSY